MWYYSSNNVQHGPVEESIISQLIANRTINDSSLVWKEGMPDWKPLAQSDLSRYMVRTIASPPPPVPPSFPATHRTISENPYQAPRAGPSFGSPYQAPRMTWAKVFWSFEGRIPRRTYWAAIGIWLGVIMVVAGGMSALFRSSDHSLGGLVIIALIIPYLWSVIAIQAKRWHDRGKSGAMVLINLIPYVGGIWCFVECGCLRGDVGGNRYGGDPT